MPTIVIAKCEICRNISSDSNLITETEYWRVILADDQAYLGRSFVTLKNHKESLSQLSHEEWLDFETLAKHIEESYEKTFNSGRPFKWACMMNNAFKESNPAPHVHWHLRPRHEKPVLVAGEEYTDPEYAHHYRRSRKTYVEQSRLDIIAALIKQNI